MLAGEWKGKGTTLWQLCKATISIIKENCYWIPGNGKKINIWTSNILGQPKRSSLSGMSSFSDWLSEQNMHTLFDLCTWETNGNWLGWKDISPPHHLRDVAETLLSTLHGLSPSCLSIKDRVGWGKTGQYNVKEGYNLISKEHMSAEKVWKLVWHPDSIPKVNMFTWLLLHNKLLTAENLRKRGIQGPSRCVLCSQLKKPPATSFFNVKFPGWSGSLFSLIPSTEIFQAMLLSSLKIGRPYSQAP